MVVEWYAVWGLGGRRQRTTESTDEFQPSAWQQGGGGAMRRDGLEEAVQDPIFEVAARMMPTKGAVPGASAT
jgi:hypothetical protein